MTTGASSFSDGITTEQYWAKHPLYTDKPWLKREAFEDIMRPIIDRYAVQVIWHASIPEAVGWFAIHGHACWEAKRGRFWTLRDPSFDWEASCAELYERALDKHTTIAHRLRSEVRRLAYAKAPGQAMIAAANSILRRSRIDLGTDFILEMVREIAHQTLPRPRRG